MVIVVMLLAMACLMGTYLSTTLTLSPGLFAAAVAFCVGGLLMSFATGEIAFTFVGLIFIFAVLPIFIMRQKTKDRDREPDRHREPAVARRTEVPKMTKRPGGYLLLQGIETVQSDGTITSSGYAAKHPGQFKHWKNGPDNVLGERIDPKDWELWRASYYGE